MPLNTPAEFQTARFCIIWCRLNRDTSNRPTEIRGSPYILGKIPNVFFTFIVLLILSLVCFWAHPLLFNFYALSFAISNLWANRFMSSLWNTCLLFSTHSPNINPFPIFYLTQVLCHVHWIERPPGSWPGRLFWLCLRLSFRHILLPHYIVLHCNRTIVLPKQSLIKTRLSVFLDIIYLAHESPTVAIHSNGVLCSG